MSDQSPDYEHAIYTEAGHLSDQEIYAWIDRTLDNAPDNLRPLGIRVSNFLHNRRGIRGAYRGLKIAADPSSYPEDRVTIAFEKKPG